MYSSLVGILGWSPVFAQLSNVTTPTLNLTAISAVNGQSVLECWQIPEFAASASAGTVGALNLFLGDGSNATYTVIPPRFNGGVHNAPAVQYARAIQNAMASTLTRKPRLVSFTSGLIHITLPNTTICPTTEAWIQGGKYGLIIAADTANVSKYGHITTYPGDAVTIAMQIPFKPGYIPEHTVLYPGPCHYNEIIGI